MRSGREDVARVECAFARGHGFPAHWTASRGDGAHGHGRRLSSKAILSRKSVILREVSSSLGEDDTQSNAPHMLHTQATGPHTGNAPSAPPIRAIPLSC